VSPVTNGRPAVWEEVRPGQNAGQYGVIIGDFIVTTRDPKKIYPAVVNNFGPKDTYFVKAVTGCPNNYVRFSQIQAYSQTVLRAPQLPQPIQVMEPMPVEMDWKKAKMGTPPF
jgi:hypothetical protein